MAFLVRFVLLFLLVPVFLGAPSPQTVCTTNKVDLVFLVDSSGSICNDKPVKTCPAWEACVAFIHAIVNDMTIGENDARVAVTLFESGVWDQWNLSTHYSKPALLNAIDNLPYLGGNTNTTGALDSLSEAFSAVRGDRPDVPNRVILITDGKPRIGSDPYPLDYVRAAVKRVTDRDVQLFGVGVTDDIDMETLSILSSAPNKRDETYFVAKDFQSLEKIRKKLETQTCIIYPPVIDPMPECTTTQVDLVFLVDSSGSICGDSQVPIKTCDDWRACVAFIRSIVSDMTIGENDIRVALTMFNEEVKEKWGLKTYYSKPALLKALENLDYDYLGGNTNTIAALDSLSKIFSPDGGDRPGVQNTVILITDGKPRTGSNPYPMDQIQAAVKRVTDQKIRLLAVGVTDSIDMDTLKELSSTPHKKDETVFVAKDYQSLPIIKKQLETQTCANYTPGPGPKTEPQCNNAAVDLAFLIDASGSICDTDPAFNYSRSTDITCNNWNLILQFLQRIITDIFSSPFTRVGLVKFSSTAQTVFNLARYTEKSPLLSAIGSIAYEKGGTTDMTGALRLARTEVFNTAGDRTGSPNVAVIITDGRPTNASTLQAEIDAARQNKIYILSLGVTNQVDESTLQRMSDPPHQINTNYFMALDFMDIETFRRILEAKVCQKGATNTTA